MQRTIGRGLLALGISGFLVAALAALTDLGAPRWIAWAALGIGALAWACLLVLGLCYVAAQADQHSEDTRGERRS